VSWIENAPRAARKKTCVVCHYNIALLLPCCYLPSFASPLDQVAELAGFWLLSLLQTPLTLYCLTNTHTLPGPLEVALSLPLLLFLSAQLILGLWTLYRLVSSQALKFHLAQSNSVLRASAGPAASSHGSVRTEGGREHIEMTKLS
jgi:hypothetical protein